MGKNTRRASGVGLDRCSTRGLGDRSTTRKEAANADVANAAAADGDGAVPLETKPRPPTKKLVVGASLVSFITPS